MTGLSGSLYYSFHEASPGAEIPGPYRIVPLIVATVVAGTTICGTVLRSRNRKAWGAMGSLFE